MRKLLNIVVNEYIKILLKRSTIVMLIAVVAVAVGYNGIMLLQDLDNQKWAENTYYQSYDEQISWAKTSKDEGWETRVEALTYLRDNKITQNYWDDDYWINSAVYTMSEQKAMAKAFAEAGETVKAEKSQKLADSLEKAMKDKDWRAYNKIYAEMLEENLAEVQSPSGIAPLYANEDKAYVELGLWAAKYQVEHGIPPFNSDWRYRALDEVRSNKYEVIRLQNADPAEQDREAIAAAEEAVVIGEYRLDNDIQVTTSKSNGVVNGSSGSIRLNFWDVFTSSALGINIISVLIIIIAGSVISSEFSTGTIKYLLVNPVKRYKIFLAKYISILSFAALMLLIYYVINLLLSGILFGFGDFNAPYLHVSDGKVIAGSSFWFVATKYLSASVGMICMATFAFALSSVARSSALSIGLGVFLYLSGYSAVAIMSEFKIDFGRYIIFSNLELNAIAEGSSMYRGQTVAFALTVIGAYMLVFLLTAWDGFVRRDVK